MLSRLFEQQLAVVPRRQPEQADLVRQIFRHLDGAGADRPRAAEQNNVLHRVSTCRKYRYMSGALNKRLSSKSKMPPMPGKNRPESFTPASRLNMDSIKSPTTALTPRITPRIVACRQFIPAILSPRK